MAKAKCPDCKLLFESSFEDGVENKTCPCCGYVGAIEEFMCKEEEWVKKTSFNKNFLSSFKKKSEGKEVKLKQLKGLNVKGEKIDLDRLF